MGWIRAGVAFLLVYTLGWLLGASVGAPEWSLPLFGWLMYLSARAVVRAAE